MSEYIIPASCCQLTFTSLEDSIEQDNPIRFIEAFVEKLDLQQLQFATRPPKTEGRLGYHPKTLLKLYFYGYLNGIRSSRRLERECKRNVELHWLMQNLVPNYHTISDTSACSVLVFAKTITRH